MTAFHRLRFVLLLIAAAFYCWNGILLPLQGLHNNDFKHIYLGMQALLDGEEPYSPQSLFHQAAVHRFGRISLNPYVYLPFTGLAMSFLSPLSFPVASLVWFGINHLLTLIFVWLAAASLFPRARIPAAAGFLLAFAVSHPFFRTLTAGQLNLVLLTCAGVSFHLLQTKRRIAAGAVLGFAACFKIAPAIFLLYFALQRRWRELLSMATTCFVLLGFSVLIFGWQVHLSFLPMLRQMSYGLSTWQEHGATFWKDPYNQSPNSLLTHLLVGGDGIEPWVSSTQQVANITTWIASFFLLALYLHGLWRAPGRDLQVFSGKEQASYQATLLLSLLLPSLLWDHYLVITILPAAWLMREYWHSCRWLSAAGVLGLYAFICIPIPFDAEPFRSGVGLLVMSAKLFPALALFVLCCRWTPKAGCNNGLAPHGAAPDIHK